MSYPVYDSQKTPIRADDLNAMMAQLDRQARIYAAPPLNVWYDSRGLTLRLRQSPMTQMVQSGSIQYSAGFVYAQTTDGEGLPLYIFQPVTLNTDGTITNPGAPSQFVRELNNNPNVILPTYQWIWESGTTNIFEYDLQHPPDPSSWSSDFSIFSASQAVAFGAFFGNTQTIPGRLFLTLSNLHGCAGLSGTFVQLDLQEIQCVSLFGVPSLFSPCSAVFADPGARFNRDVCSIVAYSQIANFSTPAPVWAWYGGVSLGNGSVLAAALLYTPGNFGGFVPSTPSQMTLVSFDRLAFQLWLFYTPPGGEQVVSGPAYCDSYYFPAVGSLTNGLNAGIAIEDPNGGGVGIPSFGAGYNGRFAATFILGWNDGGPCQGDVLALIQGDAEPVFVGDAGNSTVTPATAFLIGDGGAGCDQAMVSIL